MGGNHASNELQELGLPIISFWGKYSLYIKLLHVPFLNMQIWNEWIYIPAPFL